MYHEETSRILNYISLQITDNEVAKDLESHKITQVDILFWYGQIVAWTGFLFQAYSVFISQETIGTGYVISTAGGLFFVSVLWSVCHIKFKQYTKYVLSIWFIWNTIIEIFIVKA